jgi:quinol monooxygenase YgiN
VPLVQLEHPVRDFATWKAAFDSDPVRREASGVRRYQIFRPIDDPNYIAVDLEFDDRAAAEAFKVALETLWRSPQAAPALGGTPRVRIVDIVEGRQY